MVQGRFRVGLAWAAAGGLRVKDKFRMLTLGWVAGAMLCRLQGAKVSKKKHGGSPPKHRFSS